MSPDTNTEQEGVVSEAGSDDSLDFDLGNDLQNEGNQEEGEQEVSGEEAGIQKLVGKWGQQLGDIKKENEQLRNQMSQLVNQLQSSKPSEEEEAPSSEEFLKNLMDRGEDAIYDVMNKATVKQQRAAEQQKAQVRQYVPNFDDVRSDIAEAMAKDLGVSSQQILGGLESQPIGALVQAAKRVETEKKLSQALSLIEKLKKGGVQLDDAQKFAKTKSDGFDTSDKGNVDYFSMGSKAKKAALAKANVKFQI